MPPDDDRTPQPTLRTERLVLRPFVPADAARIQELAGNPRVAETTLNIPHPYPDGAAEAWIAGHRPAFDRGENIVFAIVTDGIGLVGAINLRLELRHLRGEVGYWIGEAYWGRGYATEALRAVLDYGFGPVGLNRIQAKHLPRNAASGRVMQKAGMIWEATLRQYLRKDGRFEDLESYAMLRSDRPDEARQHPSR